MVRNEKVANGDAYKSWDWSRGAGLAFCAVVFKE